MLRAFRTVNLAWRSGARRSGPAIGLKILYTEDSSVLIFLSACRENWNNIRKFSGGESLSSG